MISQLPGNFCVDKLLCEARDVVCLDCAVRRLESPLVPAKIPIDPRIRVCVAREQRLEPGQVPTDAKIASIAITLPLCGSRTIAPASVVLLSPSSRR